VLFGSQTGMCCKGHGGNLITGGGGEERVCTEDRVINVITQKGLLYALLRELSMVCACVCEGEVIR
jgi:hypothetical protein